MGKATSSFEVWVERLHGKWTAVSEGEAVKLFPELKDARKRANDFLDDETVIRVCVFQRTLIESINGAGIQSTKAR